MPIMMARDPPWRYASKGESYHARAARARIAMVGSLLMHVVEQEPKHDDAAGHA